MFRRFLTPMAALTALILCVPALAGDDETGITAGLIDDKQRRGEIDRYYKDVLRGEKDKMDRYANNVIDPAQAWTVKDFTVELDSLTLTFEDGEFFPRKDAEGEVFGAVYLGTGRWHFATDVPFEQDELERLTGERELDKTFTDLFLQFTPNYFEKFKEGAGPASGDAGDADKALKYWRKRRDEQPEFWTDFDGHLAWAHIEGMEKFDRILVEAKLDKVKKGQGYMVYHYNMEDREEISLERYTVNAFNPDITPTDLICHFMRKEDEESLSKREKAYKETNTFDMGHMDAEYELYRDSDTNVWLMRGDATFTYKPMRQDLQTIFFWLNYEDTFAVEGVWDENGNELPYIDVQGLVIAELVEPAVVGQEYAVRVKYDGTSVGVIKQPDPEVNLAGQADNRNANLEFMSIITYLVSGSWHPWNIHNPTDGLTWEWKITVPKPMMVAVSGTTTDMIEEGDKYIYISKQSRPVYQGALAFGRYSVVADDPADGITPVVRVFAHAGQLDQAKDILEETHVIIDFYEQLYGVEFPYPELEIFQGPYQMGGAWWTPGVIALSGEAYLNKNTLMEVYGYKNPYVRESFLPHEVAHSWWAGVVDNRTDHDNWMMEMGAEYSSALYAEATKGPEAYDLAVKNWLDRRFAKNTKQTMPLSYVFSNRTAGRPKYAKLNTTYGRGPLILHDLRLSLGYEKTISVLRAIMMEWNDKSICNEDFQMVLEKATGMSFQSYFDQFIYANEPLRFAGTPEDLVADDDGEKKKKKK